jgi:hypothetical protein
VKAKAKIILHCGLILLLAGFPFLAAAATSSSKTGMIIPLYSYPTDKSWASLIQLKQAHPSIPFIAVINPGNGPGRSIDPNYVKGIGNLKASGIMVIGYVYTDYGSRSPSVLKNEMISYKKWYGVSGIFFDEMGSSKNLLEYYKALAAEAAALHFSLTVGNPGTTIDSNLVGIFSNLCIYENPGMPTLTQISAYSSYGKHGFSYIAFSVSGLPSQNALKSTTPYVGYLYVTNLGGSNPYDGLPSYLEKELSILSQ